MLCIPVSVCVFSRWGVRPKRHCHPCSEIVNHAGEVGFLLPDCFVFLFHMCILGLETSDLFFQLVHFLQLF